MLRAVASVPCQEYIKDKILIHVPEFLSSNHFFSVFFRSVLVFPLKTLHCIRSVLIFSFKILYCICLVMLISEAYSEPCQSSKMEFFTKIINGVKPQKTPSWIFDRVLNMYSFGWLDIMVGAFIKK